MLIHLSAAFFLLPAANGFVSVSTSCVDHARFQRTEVANENAFRWVASAVASNVVGPAILASSVIVGNMDQAIAADAGIIQSLPTSQVRTAAASPTENYLPRRLYPGTYQNYCGPTPEVQVKGGCIAHGWYGDAPKDQVDAACQQHDVAYCNCETKFLQRKRMKRLSPTQEMQTQMDSANADEEEPIPLLASMVALRFATKPALQVAPAIQADAEYFDCINKADRELIATGIRIRGEQQRTGCSTDPNLAWFCDLSGKGTLSAFEKVNLSIFLSDLDSDEKSSNVDASRWAVFRTRSNGGSNSRETLSQIEHQRESDILRRLQNGVSVSDAASSPDVMADEEKLLSKLSAGSTY